MKRQFILCCLIAGALVCGVCVYRSRVLPRSPQNPAAERQVAASPSQQSQERSDAAAFRAVAGTSESPVVDEWEDRWRRLKAEPASAARDEDMVALIEELAAIDPSHAVALARRESNAERRTNLMEAVVRGWAGANPDAAAAWAASQTMIDHGQALAAVFHGVARDPEEALRLNARLTAQDPDRAADYGSYLIAALSRVGEFDQAAAFATNGDAEVRVGWLNSAYSSWAADQPQAALEQVAQLTDPTVRRTAFDAAMSRWAYNDPPAAAQYALSLPAGHERTLALTVALREWSAADPVAAAAWMNQQTHLPEFDFGAAIVASHPDAIGQPDAAISWAESIVDPQLKVRILATVVNQWAAVDPVAARRYVETSPNLKPDERPGVLAAFEPDFTPVSILP